MVEFVLVLPILLLLVFGIIEFGNAWRTSQLLTNFTREGARRAVVPSSPPPGDIKQQIRDMMTANGLDPDQATITIECTLEDGTVQTGECPASGLPETVRVEYQYAFDFFGPRFGTIALDTESTMRNE